NPLMLTAEGVKTVSTGVDSSRSSFDKLPADISSQISQRLAEGEDVVYATFADGKRYAYSVDPETQKIVLVEEIQAEERVVDYAKFLELDRARMPGRAPASDESPLIYEGKLPALHELLLESIGSQQNSR